jgi:hypothetical protein
LVNCVGFKRAKYGDPETYPEPQIENQPITMHQTPLATPMAVPISLVNSSTQHLKPFKPTVQSTSKIDNRLMFRREEVDSIMA